MADSIIDQNQAWLTLALEATSDGIWVWDVPTGKTYFSTRYYTMLGYAPGDFPATYESWRGLLHPDDAAVAESVIHDHIGTHPGHYEVEFRLRTRKGEWLWTLGRGKTVERDADGRPVRVVGSHVNIDNRKKAEQRLSEYRDRLEHMVSDRTSELERATSLLEATFDAIPDVLGVQDNAHHVIRYNAAGYQLLDLTPAEVAGKRCFELIGRDRECEICATSEAYRTKAPASVERYDKAINAWLDVRAYPILDKDGNIIQVIEHLRDITASKRAEAENRRLSEQLQQARKMESLGTLAGGIAHDFNNLLMGIQGRVSLMTAEMGSHHPHREHAEAVAAYVRSATDLTRQLLGFARGGKYEVKPTDIVSLLTETCTMFGRTHKEIDIHFDTPDHPLIIEGDKRQMEQIFLNLLINASQAMPGGGSLRIGVAPVKLDQAFCEPHHAQPGSYVHMSIADTGSGMEEATRQKIFEPFFTTRTKGRGTGLGLASAYGIVRNHAGIITVDSEVGEGSTFHIYLPLSEKIVREEPVDPTETVTGSGTILLVDDEVMILEVGAAMLERLGYSVITVASGTEALQTMQHCADEIDLVVLDLIMPEMDGGETFDRIRECRPHIPVLLSSGYSMDGHAARIMSKGCNGFLQKPFSLPELSEKLQEVLGGDPAP